MTVRIGVVGDESGSESRGETSCEETVEGEEEVERAEEVEDKDKKFDSDWEPDLGGRSRSSVTLAGGAEGLRREEDFLEEGDFGEAREVK
mmetsp:Transcript_35990/g.49332  ORF Transcript_35990/g.49332 Transcript_35990/m.49332 type:complete len:90 (+) Transcript_35990:1046-1315(+)